MELNEILKTRRSVRHYQDKEIADDVLFELLDSVRVAPSWHNYQPARYHVIRDAQLKEKISKTLPSFNQNNVKNAPVLIVTTIVLNQSGFLKGEPANELVNHWGYYDGGLSNAHLLLKATDLGLGTLVIGLRNADKIREILDIPEEESIMSVISLGYPEKVSTMPKRKQFDEIIKIY
ncbi:MAG TPA: nitroreductase [Erysipelothrix sp.]|jgi:nitroreductase|nr:nitroreductase [Erysipelothrix sp.]